MALEKPGKEAPASDFVRRAGLGFTLNGGPYRVAGVNNHYLAFGSREEVTRVLDDAVAMHANVVRTFLQPVIGSLDGSVPTIWNWRSTSSASDLGVDGAYFLSWDSANKRMAFNDGESGLGRFDFVVAEAKKRNLKLLVSFLDFWGYTGGAQQMSAWYGSRDKYTFFAADPRTRQDYKDWVRHVLLRENALTGLLYKDDPTIFAWDLMNEPDIHPIPLLVTWVTEMAAYVKSIDSKHLLTTGHANMSDPFADLDVPLIDFGTWHGYASYAKISHSRFDDLIHKNCALAEDHGKPLILEEFGVPRSDPDQAHAYRLWLDTIRDEPACPGWVVWRLVSRQKDGTFPKDETDQFDIHNDGSPTWQVLQDAAAALRFRSSENVDAGRVK